MGLPKTDETVIVKMRRATQGISDGRGTWEGLQAGVELIK